MMHAESSGVEPIAIVGMACRVPGAGSVAEFWSNLVAGVESIRVGTREEQVAVGVPPHELDDPDFVPVSAVLPDPEYFDAGMFGMSAGEAELRDPQHKLFLELCHTALEESGYDPARYPGDIGVYAGSGEDAYQWRNVRRNSAASARAGGVGLAVHSHPDYVATLASYKLGLRGPSLTVHTACSTSLVAVHLACEALRSGECDMALAGAANLDLPLGRGYLYLEGSVNSRDGHCRPFDAAATGTVWGSGGGVVVLRRLNEAVADCADIRAVIIGNAVNNDGSTKVGFTAPSQQGQAAVTAQALSAADADPRTIGFVEAHGTGTALGDPIEVAALTSVYQRRTKERGWCAIGSVKSNIGHLGPAAGVAGLIKAVLAVERGIIPATLNHETPNPEIPFGDSPFYVNAAPSVWDDGGMPRRAAVSSFGMGGTNAHVILEQAPPQAQAASRRDWNLIQLSARTESALAASATALADYLNAPAPGRDHDLTDVCYTLRVGRAHLSKRLAVVAADTVDATSALRDKRRWITGAVGPEVPQPVFVFPGQGAQYPGMGADLYESEPIYRDTVDECCELLGTLRPPDGGAPADLREYLSSCGDPEALQQTALAQPAIFTVEYALAALWRSWGVVPRAMIGHSIGEYAAATCAGVFGLDDALRVVAKRGELMQALPSGAMIAVQLGEAELRRHLPEEASIAALNGPGACVVSGSVAVIDELAELLAAAEVGVRRLRTSHAFHSAMMEPMLPAFREAVAAAALKPPRIPFISNLTGDWVTAEEAVDPSYWVRHVRQAVRFGDGVTTAASQGGGLFLECGPGRQLSGLIRMQRSGHTVIPCLPAQGEKSSALQTMSGAAGRLWAIGCHLSAEAPGRSGRRVALPTYPWERRYYWVSPDPGIPDSAESAPELGRAVAGAAGLRFAVPVWRQLSVRASGTTPPRVLVLDGGDDMIGQALAERGGEVIRVHRGPRYQADRPGRYCVSPASREDYDALLAELARQGGIPAHIVHCWTAGDPPAAGAEATWEAQDDGFFSILALVQALAGTTLTHDVRLTVVTAGTQDATGQDLRRPEHATVAGTVKVLPAEFPWLSVRHIDVDPDFVARVAGGRDRRLAAALIDEVYAEDTAPQPEGEALVALRNARRWHRAFEEVAPPTPLDGVALRERGVYLITGGLGGMGITLAEDLATKYRARLVLVAREGLPPRGDWDGPRSAVSPRVARAMSAIRRMEEAGAQVQVIPADVADPAAVRDLRREVAARFGAVNGIIHAAGVAGGGMAELKDRDSAQAVLRPKLAGTLALRDAFADDELDFVVLCSSVTAIAGGLGQVDYCAANSFLDAHSGSDHGWDAPVISVNWGAWLEVGMAAEASGPAAFRTLERGQRAVPIAHNLLTERYTDQDGASAWCSGTVSSATHWLLADHRITGVPVLPGTAYLEVARCAFEECYPSPGPAHVVELRDVVFIRPMAVPDGTSAELRVVLAPGADGADFEVISARDGVTEVNARGNAGWVMDVDDEAGDLAAIQARCSLRLREGTGLAVSGSGLVSFGAHWGNAVRVHEGVGEGLGLLTVSGETGADPHPWTIQPALLDEAVGLGWPESTSPFLPFGYGKVVIRRAMPAAVWSHLRYLDADGTDMSTADLTLYDEEGGVVLKVHDFAMRKADETVLAPPEDATAEQPAAVSAITTSAGSEAFRRLVAWPLVSRLVVSVKSISEMIALGRQLTYDAVAAGPSMAGTERTSPPPREGSMAPGSERERAVAEIFGDLLGNTSIRADDDFFEAGGNSLVAVQLIVFLRKRFGVRLPMRRFFADPTVAGIARLIEELSGPEGGRDDERR